MDYNEYRQHRPGERQWPESFDQGISRFDDPARQSYVPQHDRGYYQSEQHYPMRQDQLPYGARYPESLTRRHMGKGPRNYKRSDARVLEDINDRLSDDPFIDASEIIVSVNNGEVTLEGSVFSKRDKRLAEDLTERIPGVYNVQNLLRVLPSTAGANSNADFQGNEQTQLASFVRGIQSS